jgi:allantoicase
MAEPSAPLAAPFMDLPDLAAERVGGAVVWANDEFFAEKENLLKLQRPVFLPDRYTDRGKWMDGWETRRRREPGHDSCIVRLGLPGIVRGVVVDTSFFRGNYPEGCSIEAAAFAGQPTVGELLAEGAEWIEIVPRSRLKGDAVNTFELPRAHAARTTHLRLHIHPDGGVARLRVHGDVVPHPRWLGRPDAEVDLAALEHGAKVVRCNDMFFGSRHNLVLPGPSTHMGDGWETRRSRKEAPDWAIVELAAIGHVDRLEVDTSHFKGNFPESCAVHGAMLAPGASDDALASMPESAWREVLARTKLQAHTRHFYEAEVADRGPFSHLRLRIFPDGGVARFRAFGRATEEGRQAIGLRHLRLAPLHERRALLGATCGSSRWLAAMLRSLDAAPDLASLHRASEAAFDALEDGDWREAFRAHPRIGEKKAEIATGLRAAAWAGGEQAKVEGADDDRKAALAKANQDYEARFGFLYIVCATGKSADELLALARARMAHAPEEELRVAAGEQRKITALRLDKLAAWK